MPCGSGSGQDKDTGPNDAANTQENELPAMQFSPKMTFSITRLTELIHRLCSENVHNAFPAVVIHPEGRSTIGFCCRLVCSFFINLYRISSLLSANLAVRFRP